MSFLPHFATKDFLVILHWFNKSTFKKQILMKLSDGYKDSMCVNSNYALIKFSEWFFPFFIFTTIDKLIHKSKRYLKKVIIKCISSKKYSWNKSDE